MHSCNNYHHDMQLKRSTYEAIILQRAFAMITVAQRGRTILIVVRGISVKVKIAPVSNRKVVSMIRFLIAAPAAQPFPTEMSKGFGMLPNKQNACEALWALTCTACYMYTDFRILRVMPTSAKERMRYASHGKMLYRLISVQTLLFHGCTDWSV